MKDFKIRCSAIGDIMTNGRKKDDILGVTAKAYCQNWIKEQLYDRTKQIQSKYLDKGAEMESESISLISEHIGVELSKNEERFENEHMTGTPDVITDDMIIEIKNSWDCFTFPLFEDSIPTKNYIYQCQGYMYLTDKNKCNLIYTLNDTPFDLIDKEYRFSNKYGEVDIDDFAKDYLYSHLDSSLRIKTFEVIRDDNMIADIIERVEVCREYVNSLVSLI